MLGVWKWFCENDKIFLKCFSFGQSTILVPNGTENCQGMKNGASGLQLAKDNHFGPLKLWSPELGTLSDAECVNGMKHTIQVGQND